MFNGEVHTSGAFSNLRPVISFWDGACARDGRIFQGGWRYKIYIKDALIAGARRRFLTFGVYESTSEMRVNK
ncbi:hypothetical protein GCM10007895_05540 [Paraferrimonas sedimenticola]|uniref:Uncharacterized protein n=1 Tax=Paraferrimonas sedimenticola TaxID=375674 RepID=A0AA37W0B1_9GAMM|nr:hypothetical protein GCM10007895_05540 [Paraferrimonas sedimenticola]